MLSELPPNNTPINNNPKMKIIKKANNPTIVAKTFAKNRIIFLSIG
jgi:hypothetical protein